MGTLMSDAAPGSASSFPSSSHSFWYLDVAEQAKVMDLLGEDPERWIVAFAIGTGVRQGEQWCLHLEDVHVEGDEPHVAIRFGSWDPTTNRYRPPKGRAGEKRSRRVPLFGVALQAAKEWLKVLPSYAPENPHGLMFPTPAIEKEEGTSGRRHHDGGARRDRKPPACWAKVVEGLGIIPHIGRKPWWHLLRHTCASSLVSGWWGQRWRLEDVRAVLGHTDIKTTQRYAHLAPDAVQAVAGEAHAAWEKGHAGVTASREIAEKPSDPDGAPQRIRTSDLRLRRPRVGNALRSLPGVRRASVSREPGARLWAPSGFRMVGVLQQ